MQLLVESKTLSFGEERYELMDGIAFSSRVLPKYVPQNLFPAQIENILSAHPVIKEAAAISVPDEKYGEVVGVWIVREHTSICPQSSDLTAEDVRSIVKQGMNPQVSFRGFLEPDTANHDVSN